MNDRGNPGVGGAPFQRVVSVSGDLKSNSIFGVANKSNYSLGGLASVAASSFKLEPSVWGQSFLASRRSFENILLTDNSNPLFASWRIVPQSFLFDRARWVVRFF
jgi:hypothetical protein